MVIQDMLYDLNMLNIKTNQALGRAFKQTNVQQFTGYGIE